MKWSAGCGGFLRISKRVEVRNFILYPSSFILHSLVAAKVLIIEDDESDFYDTEDEEEHNQRQADDGGEQNNNEQRHGQGRR